MATLAEIRAKLKQQDSKNTGKTGDKAIFPFWNMNEGETTTFRFLPDGNESNDFFWQERLMIKLPFPGIKGDTDSRPCVVQVPCMEMYNETCPILSEVRGWFKDKSMEDMGRKYWKKRSYVFQGLVVDSSIKESAEETPENPIRRMIIGPQIYKIIYAGLLDPELEHLPTDYANGLDFRITKSSKGGFADYSGATWSRRERPLSDEETTAIEQYGLHDLSDFIPKKPTEVELKIITELFEASVDGELYDPDRWSNYFRPAGLSSATGDPNKGTDAKDAEPAKTEAATPATDTAAADSDEIPFEGGTTVTEKASEGESKGEGTQDILAMIRNRQKAD